ncbi:TetR/AcrR family transcriptional regulator [Paramicrobacterium chengjingii]|uniref:TetR/AcrR family transcriptional regulator n=1 Tax=Paramicrobacterium chengjingii TaxID=2769067 RepID=A0ABX6YLU8_9MICO|nr:TetR/AcrR family transcriptional regulator [Microbacterium chengjingii]QPZ39376.1 TetR/AcrR family transcriptional regulator [Microbacterium chengjingii]
MSLDEHNARPKRKDAALNNERLVQAAREVFAQQGLSATLEDIARHAGIGVGTVYRNFSSKKAIVETLYDAAVDSALAEAQTALEIEDPWLAIVAFFEITAANQARDRGLCETFLGNDGFGPHERIAEKLVAVLSPLFDRAHAAGLLRDGVSVTDIGPIFAMLNSVYRVSDEHPDLWRRYLALILDGLRARDRLALPVPALDVAAFATALTTGD